MFHSWDFGTERFAPAEFGEKKCLLIVDGKDEVISESFISRFLTIGTLLRRLELFLEVLRTQLTQEGPVVHAHAHALSTVITYLQLELSQCPSMDSTNELERYTLSAIWMSYDIYEELLATLAELYGRDENRLPQEYIPFNPSPDRLLSQLYSCLGQHITRQSSRPIRAVLAFLLTTVSSEYFRLLSQSVGYGIDSTWSIHSILEVKEQQHTVGNEEEADKDLLVVLNSSTQTFPDFFPDELTHILPTAQKSLILLRTAQPDHPLLHRTSYQEPLRWFWTCSSIEAAWVDRTNVLRPLDKEIATARPLPHIEGSNREESEFAIFRVFDSEPGTNLSASALMESQALRRLRVFIEDFPSTLPDITPSLAHLAELVLAPLMQHASTLSGALLALFLPAEEEKEETDNEDLESKICLKHQEDNLDFQSHIFLLRSYFLLTSPSFKERLSAAVFSDSDSWEVVANRSHSISMSIRSVRRKSRRRTESGATEDERSKTEKGRDKDRRPWAVGLAPSLLERETWPPVGADLSYFLRTVIVDSFEDEGGGQSEGISGGRGRAVTKIVAQEAEYRLGFAIRDLPIGTGKEKWLDPLAIEALDFLYMNYRPPRSVEVLIPTEILSKYQRMFTFLLRLMRVENALSSFFRLTRTGPLFPTLVKSQKQLLHLRFVAQSFISSLSAYVADTAIRGNFEPFLVRLRRCPGSVSDQSTVGGFSDVFALARGHSALLDDVLSACLLRTSQRAVGELLRQVLELILELAVVAGERFRGRMEEYEAAGTVSRLGKSFLGKVATFVKVLKTLVEKQGLPLGLTGPLEVTVAPQDMSEGVFKKPTGGTTALRHLYVRLDLGNWWVAHKRR